MFDEYAHFYSRHLPLFAVWLALVVVVTKMRRETSWSVVLWMPAVAVTGGCTFYCMKQLHWQWQMFGGDSFAFGMALFYLISGVPIVGVFIVLLSVRPARAAWHAWAAISGAMVAILASIGITSWFQALKPTIEFHVVDSAGRPMPGVNIGVRAPTWAGSGPVWQTFETADANGSAIMRLPYLNEYSRTFHSPGYQDHIVYFTRTASEGLFIDHHWCQNSMRLDSQTSELPKQRFVSIPVVMRAEMPDLKPRRK